MTKTQTAPETPITSLVGFVDPVNPEAVYARAGKLGEAAKKVIEQHKLYEIINTKQGKRKYIKLEGWQAIGTPIGLFVKVTATEPLANGNGWKARAVIITNEGKELSAAEMSCGRDESKWKNRPENEIMSMSQTRAASKAFRMILAWIPKMLGSSYEGTSAEEMDGGAPEEGESAVDKARAKGKTEEKTETKPPPEKKTEPKKETKGTASKPETRQLLFARLGQVGFKKDEEKRAAFFVLMPKHKGKSTSDIPEGELQGLITALKGVKDGEHELVALNTKGDLGILRKRDSVVLYPEGAKLPTTDSKPEREEEEEGPTPEDMF